MDETEGDSRYLPNYGANQGYESSQRPKVSVHNVPHSHSQQITENYVDEVEDEVEEDEEEQEQEVDAGDGDMNGAGQQNGDDIENEDDDTDKDGDGENHSRNNSYNLHRHPKKRKLKSLLSSFEFASRPPPPPPPATASTAKTSFGGRNTLTEWSEHETIVLLEAWGERFLKRRRKSLRSKEWQEVAEKVSQGSKIERTDTQCRNRLDTLKKKYKREKAFLDRVKGANTKWVYFKKMDMLISSTSQQAGGLSCGVDSGEYVFMNPTVYVDRANGLDEMRDSPGNTDSQEGDDDDDFDLLPTKRSNNKRDKVNGGSFRLLVDSINKFSEIYEKIEAGKRKQMIELENMRMEFYKELELQKRQILNRAKNEIAKIRQVDSGDKDSAENISG